MTSGNLFDVWTQERAAQAQEARDLLLGNIPFLIVGPTAVGKTRFISDLVFHPTLGIPVEWVNLPGSRDPLATVNLTIQLLKENPPEQRVTIVLDGVEIFSAMALGDIIASFRNLKIVRNVVGTSRRVFGFPGVREIIVSEPQERLYGLREQVIIPAKHIIKTVAPTIVTANDVLIEKLKRQPTDLFKVTARQFEEVIADLLKDMGMDVELTPQTRDGGADIFAYMDTDLGKLLCLVEAKQYRETRPVGVSLVRGLYGTVVHQQASKGMLVTTSRFTKDAQTFQQKHEYILSLKDYSDVLSWILKYKQR